MPEELGKIEKPSAEEFKKGRKIYFAPLVLSSPDLPEEFTEKLNRYWEQVNSQIENLEAKLGPVKHLYHELVPETGEEGLKALEKINPNGLPVFRSRVEKGAVLEGLEDNDLLTEIMDWSRCLSIGLQSRKVFSTIHSHYIEANNKRNEAISQRLNDTLKDDESCIVVMGESHHVKFPSDINMFYIAPPALDELKRWIREYEEQLKKEAKQEAQPPANEAGPTVKGTGQPEEHTSQKEDKTS